MIIDLLLENITEYNTVWLESTKLYRPELSHVINPYQLFLPPCAISKMVQVVI